MQLHRRHRQYALYECLAAGDQSEPVLLSFRQGDGTKGAIAFWPADFSQVVDRQGQPVAPRPGYSGKEPAENLDGRSASFDVEFRDRGARHWRTLDRIVLDGTTWCSAPNINVQFNRNEVELRVRCTALSAPFAVEVSGR